MTAVSVKNSIHMNIIENILPRVSVNNRNFVFSYIDVELDSYLVNYFKINTSQLPKVIVYNFEERKYYVDEFPLYGENHTEETITANINKILRNVKNDTVTWSTGNWMEDLLLKFGVKLNQHTIMYILAACFGMIVVIMIIIIFYCGEKNEHVEGERIVEEINKRHKEGTLDLNSDGNLNREEAFKTNSSSDKKNQ
jgi:hypothetical protein